MIMARILALSALVAGGLATAQELPHPSRMGLPDSGFERPDPADYELVLGNGLTAYVARAGHVPLVTLSAFVRTGLASDDKAGAAETLREALQFAGPASGTPGEFRQALELMTARYTVDMHDEWTEITLNVPVEDIDSALTLFAGVIMRPAIGEFALERAADKAAPGGDDLGGESGPALYEGSLAAAVDRFHEILYADHPYGRKTDAADFDALTVADVIDFHARHFVAGNMTLAIAGDIDVEEMQERLVALFSGVSAREAPEPRIAPDIGSLSREQHDFPVEKLQSWLVFGHDLPRVPLADEAALEVMNYILAGGHLYTRMTVETRYRYGYTNDASGFLEPRWFGPGSYTFRSYSRHEVIKPLYDNMMAEVLRMRAEEVADEELFIAKGALTEGAFEVRYLDGYATTRNFALEKLRYGDHSRSGSYVDRIRAVTADDVLDAARRYLHPERMQVVLVGEPRPLLD